MALAFVWPLGVTGLFASLLLASRDAIIENKPTPLSRATAFLHHEYRPSFFYWEVIVLAQRIVLNGALVAFLEQVSERSRSRLLPKGGWLPPCRPHQQPRLQRPRQPRRVGWRHILTLRRPILLHLQGQQLLRLLIALQVSLGVLLITLYVAPFKAGRTNALSVVTSAALTWMFLAALMMRVYQSISDELEVSGTFRISVVMGSLTGAPDES